MKWLAVFFLIWTGSIKLAADALEDVEFLAPAEVVKQYHHALTSSDAAALRQTLGTQIAMYNGAGSPDQLDWQAHMFLSGDQVAEWSAFMATGAGPHVNEISLLQTNVRAGMSLVVTRETGQNKFLTWENDRFVYMLGQENGHWRIVGLFLPEAKNPE